MTTHRSSLTQALPVSHEKYATAPDGGGASVVTRKSPVGADPLAIGAGVNDCAASKEFLAAKRAQLAGLDEG
jgi:hypothetical protein